MTSSKWYKELPQVVLFTAQKTSHCDVSQIRVCVYGEFIVSKDVAMLKF